MKEIIKVQGMSCVNCVNSVEESVNQLSGVSAVKVELDSGDVSVTFDEKKTTLKEIKEVIEEQGYNVA